MAKLSGAVVSVIGKAICEAVNVDVKYVTGFTLTVRMHEPVRIVVEMNPDTTPEALEGALATVRQFEIQEVDHR